MTTTVIQHTISIVPDCTAIVQLVETCEECEHVLDGPGIQYQGVLTGARDVPRQSHNCISRRYLQID